MTTKLRTNTRVRQKSLDITILLPHTSALTLWTHIDTENHIYCSTTLGDDYLGSTWLDTYRKDWQSIRSPVKSSTMCASNP